MADIRTLGENGNVKDMQDFLNQNGDINETDSAGYTVLHYASGVENLELVKFLIENNAEANPVSQFNMTPLDMTSGEVAEYLKANGAKSKQMGEV